MRIMKVSVEFHTWPLWVKCEDGFFEDKNPKEFGISQQLCDEIELWQAMYDATFSQEYPPDSDFKSKEEEAEFIKKGHEIFEKLKKELAGKYIVEMNEPPWA